MKIAHLMLSLGLACAAFTTSTAMAADATYPPAPLPPYAHDELQKVIDAATGRLPVVQPSSAAPQSADTLQSPAVLQKGSYAAPRVMQHDESHAAASASKRGARPSSKAHRHERHKYV